MAIPNITQQSASSEKIAFFRSLFKGRDDLYPQRFESRKTGKAGYSPACGNEWVRGICEKPKIKCSECRHRCFLPINENVDWFVSLGRIPAPWESVFQKELIEALLFSGCCLKK